MTFGEECWDASRVFCRLTHFVSVYLQLFPGRSLKRTVFRKKAQNFTLFVVNINSLARVIPPSILYSLNVGYVQISYSSSNMSNCERLLQFTMKRIIKWTDENGLNFPVEKTIGVSFCLRRGLFPDLTAIEWSEGCR